MGLGDSTARRRRFRASVVALIVLASAGLAAQAQAATSTVGNPSDTTPGTPCTPSSGTCSLRQLIEYENGLAPTPSPPDMINVPAGTYDLTNGVLTITQSVSIVGAGARVTTVAQTSSTPDRVFDVQIPGAAAPGAAPTVSISGLKITGGTSSSSNGFFGGDVRSDGTLTLSEDWITGGTATAGSGGGVSNYGGKMTVTHSLVSGNTSTCCGGDSGGIQNFGPNPVTNTAGTLEVDNSTVAGNTAALGGGIFSWCGGTNGACSSNGTNNVTTIVNSTIAYNDGGTRSTTGGGLLESSGATTVQNSIVAYNTVDTPSAMTASNCGASSPGTITSLGYNLETGTDCAFTSTGDLQNGNPGFTSAAPQNNGGNTDTLGLASGSVAVDHVPSSAGGCVGSDQRDVARPQGSGCDIGAYELSQTGGPVLTPGAPNVISTTSAAFTVNVNPEGLATTVMFEYGPELPNTPFSYISTTPAQPVGPDFSNHTVTATVTDLLPRTLYHVRAIATNSAGTGTGADQTLTTPADPQPPPPVLGKTVNATVVSGLVLVKLPGNRNPYASSDTGAHAAAGLSKGVGFVPLTEARQLPTGTQVDARLGAIALKAASSTKHGKLQTGTFKGGLFKLSQDRKGLTKGLTTLSLLEGAFPGAPTYAGCKAKKAADSPLAFAALSSAVLQSMKSSAHGKFRTRGRYSAATVRGTAWTISDRCDGTLVTVQRHTVLVQDFVRHVTVLVRAGHRYLARAPTKRRKHK